MPSNAKLVVVASGCPRWKLVERLLNKARKSSPESAFKALKDTLVRMQALTCFEFVCGWNPARISACTFNSQGTKRLQTHFSEAVGSLGFFPSKPPSQHFHRFHLRPFDELRRQMLIDKCAAQAAQILVASQMDRWHPPQAVFVGTRD